MTNNLKDWVAEIRRLATEDGAPDYVGQNSTEADWMNAFAESYASGATPQEAWADEKSYAVADAG